jgi:hypothetical protein
MNVVNPHATGIEENMRPTAVVVSLDKGDKPVSSFGDMSYDLEKREAWQTECQLVKYFGMATLQ